MFTALFYLTLLNTTLTFETGYSYAPIAHEDNHTLKLNHGIDFAIGLKIPVTKKVSVTTGYRYRYFFPSEGIHNAQTFKYRATLGALTMITSSKINPWITVGLGWGFYGLDWYNHSGELLDSYEFDMYRYHFGLNATVQITYPESPLYFTISGTMLSLDYNDRVMISTGIGYNFDPAILF